MSDHDDRTAYASEEPVATLREVNNSLRKRPYDHEGAIRQSLRNFGYEPHNNGNNRQSYNRSPQQNRVQRIVLTIQDITNPEKSFKAKMLSTPAVGDYLDIDGQAYSVIKVARRISLPTEKHIFACEFNITVFVAKTDDFFNFNTANHNEADENVED